MLFAKDLDKILPKELEEESNNIERAILAQHQSGGSRCIRYTFKNTDLKLTQKKKIVDYLRSFGYEINDTDLCLIGYKEIVIHW